MVGAHCRWEVRLDTVLDRVPSTITEIVCHTPDETCGGNVNYRCRQIRARCAIMIGQACFEEIGPHMGKGGYGGVDAPIG